MALLPRWPVASPPAVFAITYAVWTVVHAARKSYSAIKPVLVENEWFTAGGGLARTSSSERAALPDTVFFLAYALATLWKGKVSDARDPRLVIALGLAGAACLLALFGLGYFFRVHALAYYSVLWGAEAFCQALVWPGAIRVMGDWFRGPSRSFVMGAWTTANNVGNIAGTATVELAGVVGFGEDWGVALLVIAAAVLAVAWLVQLRLTPAPALVGREPYGWSKEEEQVEQQEQAQAQEDSGRRPLLTLEDAVATADGPVVGEDGVEGPLEAAPPQTPPPLQPVSMWREAVWLPGVLEVSLSYAALKGTTYALFFWLPVFLSFSFSDMGVARANSLAMLYDVGQIVGSPLAGLLASRSRRPHASNCLLTLTSALPIFLLFLLQHHPGGGLGHGKAAIGALLFVAGATSGAVNLLPTSICQEIGSSRRLGQGKAAVATVASIVDGLGSLGAAIVQLLVGRLATCRKDGDAGDDDDDDDDEQCDLDGVFILLTCGSLLASLALVRLAVVEHRERSSWRQLERQRNM